MGWHNHKNATWNVALDNPSWDAAHAAILMDIRDELQKLNGLFRCMNFLNIPFKLDKIVKNTSKPKRKKKKKKAAVT